MGLPTFTDVKTPVGNIKVVMSNTACSRAQSIYKPLSRSIALAIPQAHVHVLSSI